MHSWCMNQLFYNKKIENIEVAWPSTTYHPRVILPIHKKRLNNYPTHYSLQKKYLPNLTWMPSVTIATQNSIF